MPPAQKRICLETKTLPWDMWKYEIEKYLDTPTRYTLIHTCRFFYTNYNFVHVTEFRFATSWGDIENAYQDYNDESIDKSVNHPKRINFGWMDRKTVKENIKQSRFQCFKLMRAMLLKKTPPKLHSFKAV